MAPEELAVWIYGDRVATVARERGRIRLSYTEEARARYALGTPLLSLSLPVDSRVYPQGVTRSFLDGLLPEGGARRVIARELGVAPSDTYGLIAGLGRDCAGAVVIQPIEDGAPPSATTSTAEPLGEDELAELVANLRSSPLGAGGRVRISLAGMQDKLLLTKMPDGRWGRPVDGTPSTHILKPEIAAFPRTVQNEAFCMRLGAILGLDVAEVETTEIAGRELIVVRRYDRLVGVDGTVTRLHQEDFCQATGTSPEHKYQEEGGPALRQLAGIATTVAVPDDLERLLAAVVMNVLIGNGDAHAKNFSLLHLPSGALRLAPLYDLMCTLAYGDEHLAMRVDDVRRTDQVGADRIVNEAARWGMARDAAVRIVTGFLDRAEVALEEALGEARHLPERMAVLLREQLRRLRATAPG